MSRRQVRRERRHTERALDEAFRAFARGELHLALRIGRRARDAGGMNPRILVDFAELALACGELQEAEEGLRTVLTTTPSFVAAHEQLANVLFRMGRREAALRTLARAVKLDPDDPVLADRLREWQEQAPLADAQQNAAAERSQVAPPAPMGRFAECDLERVAEQLCHGGAAVMPRVLTVAECESLRSSYAAAAPDFDREDRCAEPPARARGRHFLQLPPWLTELREQAFAAAADVLSRLRRTLLAARGGGSPAPGADADGRPPAWPLAELPGAFEGWRRREPQFAGPRPMLRVLTCAEGAVPGPAQVDPRAFPLRLVVDLGPLEEAVASVAVVDHRPGRKVRERVVRTRAGDAVLFAARQRLDRVGGVYGLQLVRWRFGPFAVERWLLDVPFDDG